MRETKKEEISRVKESVPLPMSPLYSCVVRAFLHSHILPFSHAHTNSDPEDYLLSERGGW
jgi:hypothetical protein